MASTRTGHSWAGHDLQDVPDQDLGRDLGGLPAHPAHQRLAKASVSSTGMVEVVVCRDHGITSYGSCTGNGELPGHYA